MTAETCRRTCILVTLALVSCGDGHPKAQLPTDWTEPVTGMEFVLVPPGKFEMGLKHPPDDLRPAEPHQVHLSRPIYLGRFEVTQAQWRRIMASNPSQSLQCGAKCPVEMVSWHDVQEFLERLQTISPNERFRLPTEAEWEYACRAGSDSRYGSGVDTLRPELANYDGRIPFDGVATETFVGRPLPVGSFPPNAWGLYDVAGNVWEWTADEYCLYPRHSVVDPIARCGTDTVAIRGGSWLFSANAARCGRRYTHARTDSGYGLGFRVVREVKPLNP